MPEKYSLRWISLRKERRRTEELLRQAFNFFQRRDDVLGAEMLLEIVQGVILGELEDEE